MVRKEEVKRIIKYLARRAGIPKHELRGGSLRSILGKVGNWIKNKGISRTAPKVGRFLRDVGLPGADIADKVGEVANVVGLGEKKEGNDSDLEDQVEDQLEDQEDVMHSRYGNVEGSMADRFYPQYPVYAQPIASGVSISMNGPADYAIPDLM
jgi:hypothetical protein